MAKKEEKPIFFKVLAIVLVIAVMNVGFLAYWNGNASQKLTGFSINENINILQNFNSFSTYAKIFMVCQWVLLLSILLYAVTRDKRIQLTKSEAMDFHIQTNPDKNKTDLDTLYELLQNKKELSISAISKLFDVDKDIALEWCKILESGELVSISYPAFSEPVVRINEKEIKNITPEKSNISRDSIKIKEEIEEKEDVDEEESETDETETEESETDNEYQEN